jgi:hypothetical protein
VSGAKKEQLVVKDDGFPNQHSNVQFHGSGNLKLSLFERGKTKSHHNTLMAT